MANSKDVLFHIEKYENRLHTSFFDDWDIQRFPFVLLLPDGSFSTYGVKPDTIEIGPTCGELKPLLSLYLEIAKMAKIKRLRTFTTRNPKAYARLSGGTLVDTYEEEGTPTEYIFELEV